jgi:hypothetical protein
MKEGVSNQLLDKGVILEELNQDSSLPKAVTILVFVVGATVINYLSFFSRHVNKDKKLYNLNFLVIGLLCAILVSYYFYSINGEYLQYWAYTLRW